ncbi:MAG: hypothetical protein Q4B78_03785, partial [Bacillota bacterium]|nr:hypothetical protein [Bacillota bacterium]
MRKIAIILCAALLIMLTACGTPSPTDVTKSFLDGVKAQDTEAVGNVYEAGGDFALSSKELSDAMIEEGDEGNDILKDFSDDFTAKLLDYDYEITDE